MVLQVSPSTATPTVTWESLPADYMLPDDPVENIHQPRLAAALTDALGQAGRIDSKMLIASNFALVATVNDQTIVKAPDWLYVSRVMLLSNGITRRSYTPYLEGDGVSIVMEFLSDTDCGELSTRSSYPYGKLYVYERILRVPIYVTYEPKTLSLDVRQLGADGRYEIQDKRDRYWIPSLELFLGIWQGTRLGQDTHWLRWWDAEGRLLPWSAEEVQQECQRAEQERQRADQECQRADQAEQRAAEAEAELARLRSLLTRGAEP
jgi:Putative restriction endonuclease